MNAETINQALTRLGYTTERVDISGKVEGMRITLNGRPVHKTPYASVDLAIDLIEAGGGFRKEGEI